MNPKVSLLMALVIVTQLTQINSLPTTSKQSSRSRLRTISDDPDKHAYFPHLYVFGGRNESSGYVDSASRLKSTTGEWRTMNNMPVEQAYMCGAVVDKQIYLFGGSTVSSGGTDSAEVYDCSTDTYTLLRSMPGPRSACAAAALKHSVYVAGGNGGTSSFIRYDIRDNQWSTLTPMDSNRVFHQLVELGGLLYAIGWSRSTEVYNPTTDRWSYVASSNIMHDYGGAAAHQGNIYVLSYNGFEVYLPSTNQWTVLNAPGIVKNYGRSLVSMNGRLWAVGGGDQIKATKTNTVYTYDPSTDRWTKEREMDTSRVYHSAFVVNH